MVSRRALLAGAATLASTALAGCTGAKAYISCHYDGDVDTLELGVVDEGVATGDGAVVVEYGSLSSPAQNAVEQAASMDERYTECHEFGDGQSGIAQLYARIEQAWGDVDGDPPRDRTYLRYDGQYYGIRLFELDVGRVHSLPS